MRHVLFILLAAVCFGTTGTAQAFGPDDASALSIGAARIAIGGGALALVGALARTGLLRAGTFGYPRDSSVRAAVRVSSGLATPGATAGLAPTWVVVALGAAGVVAYQPAVFAGTSENGVAVGTIVALGSAPVITGGLEWAITRRFPGLLWLIATTVATFGVVLLSGIGGTDAVSVPGLLASLGAGASYAVYALASKRLLVRGWTPTAAMGSIFGLAAAASVPLLLVTDLGWLTTAEGVTLALWLGLVTTTVAYLLFASGLVGLTAATVSTLTLAEPLTATLLGILLLNERLSGNAVLGLIVLALGLVILVVPRRARAAVA